MKDYRFLVIVLLLMVIVGVLVHVDDQMIDEQPSVIFQCGAAFD